MKKQSILNLIRYHVERNENAFRNEAISIARYFDSIGDDQLAEYIMSMIAQANQYVPQGSVNTSGHSKSCATKFANNYFRRY